MKKYENIELIEKINYLKEKREAVILAHNYQRGEAPANSRFCW